MFKNLTYKQKNLMLLIGTLLFLWISYSLSFSKTISLKKSCIELESKLKMADSAPIQIQALEKQLQQLNEMIGNDNVQENTQQQLLDYLSIYCKENHTVLRAFPQAMITKEQDMEIETSHFAVEGIYANLLKLIYELEQKNKITEIASVNFQSKKDIATKRISLTATIYTQNIKRQTHE